MYNYGNHFIADKKLQEENSGCHDPSPGEVRLAAFWQIGINLFPGAPIEASIKILSTSSAKNAALGSLLPIKPIHGGKGCPVEDEDISGSEHMMIWQARAILSRYGGKAGMSKPYVLPSSWPGFLSFLLMRTA